MPTSEDVAIGSHGMTTLPYSGTLGSYRGMLVESLCQDYALKKVGWCSMPNTAANQQQPEHSRD